LILKDRINRGDLICNTFDFWCEKYGLKIANIKEEQRRIKLSKAFSGENNPMFGKPSPKESGNGWSGWYKEWFFRSIRELSYVVNVIEKQGLKWRSAETQEFAIRYTINGKPRTYFPDFLVDDKNIVECKPARIMDSDIVKAKTQAAQKFCKNNSLLYTIVDPDIMSYDKILLMTINGEVSFTTKSIDKVLSYTRYKKSGAKGKTILLTGLSGSGKTTISNKLKEEKPEFVIIDGDTARTGISHDLGLNKEDRKKHASRVSKVSNILNNCGYTVIVALIMPYRDSRENMRKDILNFLEVFVDCPIDECRRRDPKGLYAKYDKGEITGMTGIDAPYEAPSSANLVVHTHLESVDVCVERILLKI